MVVRSRPPASGPNSRWIDPFIQPADSHFNGDGLKFVIVSCVLILVHLNICYSVLHSGHVVVVVVRLRSWFVSV